MPTATQQLAPKVPPHSEEAERATLGSLLIDNRAWDNISDKLSVDDFYRHENGPAYDGQGQYDPGKNNGYDHYSMHGRHCSLSLKLMSYMYSMNSVNYQSTPPVSGIRITVIPSYPDHPLFPSLSYPGPIWYYCLRFIHSFSFSCFKGQSFSCK